jgi:hypothetical protein
MLGITQSYTQCASNYIELVLIMRQNQVYLIQSISLNSGLFRECTVKKSAAMTISELNMCQMTCSYLILSICQHTSTASFLVIYVHCTYTVKKVGDILGGNNLIIPTMGEFGKWHPGWGRECR